MNFWEKRIIHDFIGAERFHIIELEKEINETLNNKAFQKAAQNGDVSNECVEVLNAYKRSIDQYGKSLVSFFECLNEKG